MTVERMSREWVNTMVEVDRIIKRDFPGTLDGHTFAWGELHAPALVADVRRLQSEIVEMQRKGVAAESLQQIMDQWQRAVLTLFECRYKSPTPPVCVGGKE